MKNIFFIILALFMAFPATRALAGPDQFMGDSAIYSGDALALRPNVLLLIDNSNVTTNAASGAKYDPTVDYCATYGACNYSRYSIYKAGQQGEFSTTSEVDNTTSALEHQLCSNNGSIVTTTLTSSGTYVGSGTTDHPNLKRGTGANKDNLVCDTAPKGATYALGNFLNYTQSSPLTTGDTQQKIVYDAIETVVGGARYAVDFGAMVYGHNNKGGEVVYQIGDLSSDTDFNAFLGTLPGGTPGQAVLSSATARPQAESLLDAGYYFWGLGLPISGQAAMTSPIIYSCGHNHVIIITNGLSNKDDDPKLGTIVGDYDNDGADAAAYGLGTHYLDDVAKYIYENPTSPGDRIETSTILAFQADDPLVSRAADSAHGRGNYYIVNNANELAKALMEEISNIVLETDTSFVAPVVPVSPENRTFSGSRVFMGFFKPITQSYWHGNLKKFGLSSQSALTDKNANLATYTDLDGNGRDDIDNAVLPPGTMNGSFRDTSISFWTPGTTADAGEVESGGAGKVLLDRNLTSSPRTICSNIVSNALTASGNAFTTANTALTSTLLGVDSSERDKLINFIHGVDTYDENGNLNTTEKRSWIFGDILHSRPLIVNYKTYTFNTANESDCNVNGSYIFVGGDDGMLHAVKDCDGSEAWAFIPQDMLGNLNYMTGTAHTYFVDSTPSVYIYDKTNPGNITPSDGDKIILVFGERRGGGKDSAPTSGTYYAMDVTDPTTPVLLWKVDSQTTGFEELAETWSEPKIVKMMIGGIEKIVAFVGAGYDNIHEDTRYGNTQSFTNAASVNISDIGNGDTVSGGSTAATALTDPKGRGIYAIEIATLVSGVPNFTNSGTKIWGYTYTDNSDLKYSIPSEITALDADNNGYADRLYVGDTGGQIWRFDVGASSTTSWGATRIFNLSAGQGRKFFYKPSVVMEPGYAMLFIGSGDREHPLNRDTNQVDRFYALKDKGQVTSDNLDESSLTDVTGDELQTTTSTSTISSILSSLSSSYGWFIRLPNSGEKVLAAPTVFNKVAYFTTYAPNTNITDPCNPANLGVSRLYAVDYKTGEAVLNYDTTNDSPATPITNPRATSTSGQVLQTSDRSKTIGSGIPSGIVMLISPGGDIKALIGVGGVIAGENPKKGGSIKPLYWRQK